ncbi:LicD family protein, partial [Oscillospiraceae bacterium OttesenSCG-928-G22]|nr:LicD family protein [Oscillospiraceae bacterium OttesenSCG-928-G22]
MNTPYMLSPDELHKLQRVLLEMLLELDRVCKKHSIRYCLIAGTLLGAVRHGGFIPWDDDLDVGMTRGEYEKFRAVSHELDPARFFFQDHTTDPGYRWGWGRVRRLNSEFLRTGQEHMSMRTGIFLDVFPLDGVPDCYPLRALRNFECFVVRKFLYAETGTVT